MTPGFLHTFDAEDGRRPCTRRNPTVTAPQALTMMNSEMVVDASRSFARRLAEQCGDNVEAAVDAGYLHAIGRAPSAGERDQALTATFEDFKIHPAAIDRQVARFR